MDGLTPVQRRTLDDLMGATVPRPVFGEDLAGRLRAEVEGGVAALSFPDPPVWLGKHRLNDHGRCEGLFVAGLLGEGAAFEHRPQTAAGSLAHKAIELDVPRGRADPTPALVERAAARLAEGDTGFAAFWEGLDPLEASEISQMAVRLAEQFRASFPPLQTSWTPVTELSVRQEFGPVIVSGRMDLVLGAQDREVPMRARRIALDLKSGRAWPEFPEDMRLYALLMTLRFGVPPFRVASVFLDSGEWQAEDVTEDTLFHAAGRVVRAAEAAAALLAGGEPDLRPGSWCSWCPRAPSCPVAAA
ncbi:MAG TPA: PD-(D/E)XK nuclease family protein [Actinomycetota bacterium]|nr:PD-(D/E)XK nuclease family protein [Actinomycetota bacterium]